ncbi:MAG TPA: anaerobic ribonucleoside-triphosphate reductase activating protein [Candidatus Omnitrophica bacterium]|nr:MAG: anaerobic ribonucleoside-triphosphate reductase activating protein [Omnitrophica WOR_2 bacterium GWC2_45_7]HBR15703.1 anaerobic ribonucleoside-triphosphate reductase activating protein [Candidatus Omnitrophota bacterium]
MKIGGLLKFSLIDYPNKVAAVIFTQGCNFRCPFCHNPELVLPEKFQAPMAEEQVLDFLLKRRGQLEGVVVTGGEPTLQKDLLPFLKKIKDMGYQIKLDTNGSHPGVLREALQKKLVDFIAMDIKAPLEKYPQLTGVKDYLHAIEESIVLIESSAYPYQFRTTVVKSLLSEEYLQKILRLIKETSSYHLQPFVTTNPILDPSLVEREKEWDSREDIRK